MKRTVLSSLFLVLVCFWQVGMAQENTEDRPSWSDDLPEKVETPDMEVLKETRKKIELDLDMSDFAAQPTRDDASSADKDQDENEVAAAKKAELARQQAEQAEQERRLAQEQAEKERQAEEAKRQAALRQEQARLAEEKRLAEERVKQQAADRMAEEARRKELQAAEEAQRQAKQTESSAESEKASGVPASEQTPSARNNQPPASKQDYPWKFIHRVAPDYPVKAYREHKEGWVDVEVTISPNGDVQDAKVKKIYRNQRIFAKPALKAVEQWKFEPPKNYGIQQPQTRRYRVEFKLQEEAASQTRAQSLQSGV